MARETAQEKLERMTRIERELWQRGLRVAGIDEVGRGPLAGPVVTACVAVAEGDLVLGVDDSKKLSEKKREALNEQLLACAKYAKIGSVDAAGIDQMGILVATKRAMEQAAEGFHGGYFLIDAVTGLALPGQSQSMDHADAISYMVAAASIVAKVYRDKIMREFHEIYPQYGFLSNKGYGTAEHIRALKEYGPCPIHRRSFIRNFVAPEA